MCLIEVEKMPKLVIACSTYCTNGMVVQVNSEKAIQARNAVVEFILINHPLDCPICDEAGECKLQDYTYRYSVGESRFDEEKVMKRKRDPLGPHVMFDAERCISCSRCIRFCEDIVKNPQLTFVNRGDRVTIETFPGKRLDNPYSMNVIDICPVGALTSTDFRFKARVWDMSRTESICPGCARGCNVEVWTRSNEILRLKPRENPFVNNYWMCDKGRLTSFRHVNADTRISQPMIKRDGELKFVEWSEAIEHAANNLRQFKGEEIAFLGSAYDTCEDNFILQKFAREIFNSPYIDFLKHIIPEDQDDFLIRADKTPNAGGAAFVGVVPRDSFHDIDAIIKGIHDGKIRALVIMDDDVSSIPEFVETIPKLSYLLVIASNLNPTVEKADVVLASSTFAEKKGTFINFENHIQLIQPAVYTKENQNWINVSGRSRLEKFGSQSDRWNQLDMKDCRSPWNILTSLANSLGSNWKYYLPEHVFNEMEKTIPALKGLNYMTIGRRGKRLFETNVSEVQRTPSSADRGSFTEEPELIYSDLESR